MDANDPCDDCNNLLLQTIDTINKLLDINAPFRKLTKMDIKFKTKPWISDDLKLSIKYKNKLFKKYIQSKNCDNKTVFYNDYKKYRNTLQLIIKESKKNYYNNYFKKNILSMKATWKGIANIINLKTTSHVSPTIILQNNNTLTNPVDICNAFNNYFSNVGLDVQSNIPSSKNHFTDYLTNPSPVSFFSKPTDSCEIIKIIESLDSCKSYGPNSIPINILKLLKNEISNILSNIFNISFSKGVFPDILKIAKIVPIFKKDSKLLVSNYRPISLLSNIDKILERLMFNRVYNFLSNSNILYDFQFGFRSNYSTSIALLNMTENIRSALDKGLFGCGVFIDLQKAFDTVDIKILLNKLAYYGIRGVSNSWFESFLTNRKQFVSVNGSISNICDVTVGVPQGSVLGPLLFLIYINDLSKAIKFCRVQHFADDTNLLYLNKSINKINKYVNYDLKKLCNWLNANKISLNASKTELIIFKPRLKKPQHEFKIKLNGKKLFPLKYANYLGIKIDESLTWDDHIKHLTIKLNRSNAILSKLRHFVDKKTLKSLYFALFNSHLTYGCLSWGQSPPIKKRLSVIQKKAIRIINFLPHNSHTKSSFKDLQLIDFSNHIKIENCLFIHSCTNDKMPSIFTEWFTPLIHAHTQSTRMSQRGGLSVQAFNTKFYGKHSFKNSAISDWNFLQSAAIGSCRITNIISGYYLKSGINQPNIKKLGESDNLAHCKKLSCKEDVYDFGLFDGKQCYGILCLHNTDKRCMLKRDGNADYTIFKIHAQSLVKRKKHDKHHSTKKSGYQINSMRTPLKNKFLGNKTFINQSHRTFNLHKENKQLHRKHRKRREKRKAQIDAGKHAQNLFYSNQTELLYKKHLIKPSDFTSLNHNLKVSKPLNVYGFSTNQQTPSKKLKSVNPILNEVSYSTPNYVSKEVLSHQPVLINSFIHPRTLSNEEKMFFTFPHVTNNYNKELSTANLVLQDSLSNSSNQLEDSNANKRMNIGSLSTFNEDQYQSFPNNLTETNLSEKRDNLMFPVQNEITEKKIQSNSYGSQNYGDRKGIISDVQPLRDFPTDTDLAVEEKDIIPGPDDLRKLDNDQTMVTKDSIIDIPFSSKNQLQGLPVFQKGLFNASKHTQLQTSNVTLTHLYTPQKTYQVLLQQRKITGHSLYHHIPSISHTEESVVSDTDKKEFVPKLYTESSNEKSNILRIKLSSIYNRDMVPRPLENVENPENLKKSEVQKLLGPSFQNDLPIYSPSNLSLNIGNIHNVTSDTDDTDEYMMLDARGLGFQTTTSNDHNKNYDILNSGCVNPIGISQTALIKDFQFSASSSMENFQPSKARLSLKENGEEYSGSWCSSASSKVENKKPFLQVDLGKRTMFCRLAIQGDDNVRKWVKKFKVDYSDDSVKWDPYSEEGVPKIFMGNEDEKDITYQTLKNPVVARYVRFKPLQWEGDSPCLRVEMFNAGIQGFGSSVRSTIPTVHSGLIVDLDFEKMDELIALDKSSFGNNGFLHGGAKIFDTHSSCRHAVQIPVGSDIVIDGSLMKVRPRKAISIALWIQLNRVDGVHSIFDTVGSNSKHNFGQFHFEIVGGDVRWFHRNETEKEIFNLITEQKLIKSHDWNHIAATYDSKTGATVIYINGTEHVRGKGQGLISKDWSEHVGIGRHKGVRFLDGQIDEFKVYDTAITAEHVDELASKCDFSKYYCGQTLTEETGSIFSPSYPDTQNGPVECTWNIQGDVGETISLDMSQFKLGYKSDCGKGNLEVRDKDSTIGVYCGASITPRRILSHSNHLVLKYFTDGAFKGEKFRIDFSVNKRKAKKNSVNHQCVASKTIGNVTLVGGVKAGNFTDLGSVSNMEDCKDRCCNLEECQVAFLIDDSCYAVKCASPQLCQARRAKSTALYPQLAYIKNRIKLPFLNDNPLNNVPSESEFQGRKLCPHDEKLVNVTLVGGIKSGNFTSHGTVQNFEECLQYCCLMNNCDLAFMVKQTCFSLKCANSDLCTVRPARPSVYNPTVAFIKRNKAQTITISKAPKVVAILPKVLPIENNNKAACKDMRLSKVHHGVTLSGGISAGEFTDKGHVATMDECVERCCSSDSCNVAFVIKDTCFAVKCKSYNDCNLKSALSDYYNPRIVFVNWSPPKDLGESVPYFYEGCWHDFDISAFALPLLEGTSPILNTLYKKRQDPVNDCSGVSQSRGYKVFAVQNGGACFSGPNAEQTYKRYGKSDACKEGKGGPFANSVYKLFDDGSVIALGCWADLQDRSFRRMESNDPLLFDSFESRADPIGTCARVATKMKIKYFAMQKGGQCFVAKDKQKVDYNRYSPSRKCKYGLGGPMANDVYMLKLNFTDNSESINKTKVLLPQDDVFPGETVYKEEIAGNYYVRYLYKATPPMNNVTLASAINAGTFEDKGKMDTISECIKACGISPDCNVAFMLSSQCFNVHCFSDETCRTKPAFSKIYKPELSYIKHRIIKKPRNKTEISVKDKTCNPISEHTNVTFIAGINAGNFSDMGHTNTMDDCKARCCHDKDCNIAFKIEDDCYGVRCYSKVSCQMRPAKNAYLFNPQMAVIRKINDSLEQAVEENKTVHLVSLKTELSTTASPQTTSSLSTTMKKCSGDLWDEQVVRNSTLVGGINAGTFRDHGQVDSIGECMEYCCSESDCDLSFMIDQDCYTVKCYSEKVCLTRKAKPTAFTTLIAYKKAYKIAISKANLTTPVYKSEKELSPDIAYASLKSELLHPSILDVNRLTNVTEISLVEYINNLLNGTTPSSTFMFSSATNVATPSFGSPKEHSCNADPIIYNATLRMGMHSGLFTKLGRVKQMDDCIERCCHSSNADVAYMLGPFCFAVKCKTKEMCKPSPAMYSDIKSLNLNPAISFLNKPGLLGSSGQSQTSNNEKGVCSDSPINYNVTLRGGVHSGKFIELGEGITMRECVSKCCDTPLCDVAFMFSDKCYAVGCFDEASCQAVMAKPSNLNPKLAYVTKYRPNTVLSLDSATSGILFDVNNESPKTCDPETIEHGPVHVNKTLSGGMKYGYYSYLGRTHDIKSCLSKCCESGKCDMAYLVNKEQCFSVRCLTPELCEIKDHPFKNKWIEISALVKHSETKKKKYQAVSVLPLLLVSLVVMTAGLTGLIWAILIFVRRHKIKKRNGEINEDEDDGIPRPER